MSGIPTGRLLIVLAATYLLSACAETERAGNFTLRYDRKSSLGHSATRIDLLHGRRLIVSRVGDWSVDPRNPDRIVFATRGEGGAGCGTFSFDGKTNASWKLSSLVMSVHPGFEDSPVDAAGTSPWSPDGRYVYVGNDIGRPLIVDLVERRTIDMADRVSTNGRRVSVRATVWSPDSRKLAVEIAAQGYNGGRDLAVLTISSLSVEYVASMHGSLPLWTTADYHWEGDSLVAADFGKNGPIVRQSTDEVTWTSSPPQERLFDDDSRCL